MKVSVLIFSLFFISNLFAGVYDLKVQSTDGKTLNLSDYKNKTLVVVNIATRCGYTGQLDDLEKFYKDYKDKGITVIGLPSNDFGGQTPEGDKEVAKFCRLKYGASFPILKKSPVTGPKKHQLIASLIKKAKSKDEIRWNFEKFIVDKKGNVLRFSSSTNPSDQSFRKKVDAIL